MTSRRHRARGAEVHQGDESSQPGHEEGQRGRGVPVRIQRKRTKDWRMPPETVYVGRPTKWGNPFVVGSSPGLKTPAVCVDLFRRDMEAKLAAGGAMGKFVREHLLVPLRGKNLACFCPLDQPCHVDVLLDLANRDEASP